MARCQELCKVLAGDMEKEKIEVSAIVMMTYVPIHLYTFNIMQGRTITVKMKTANFEVKSRGLTLLQSVSRSGDIFQVASSLLQQEIESCGQIPLKLRLLGKSNLQLASTVCGTVDSLKSWSNQTVPIRGVAGELVLNLY